MEKGPDATIEYLILSAVERAVDRVIGPHMRKLSGPEPVVYTVAQAAVVLQVSQDTVSRLVKRGVLSRVPHLEGKVLIPRCSVAQLVESALAGGSQPEAESPAGIRSMRSAASRSEPGMK
jgi:excisionase family DNA binding protein